MEQPSRKVACPVCGAALARKGGHSQVRPGSGEAPLVFVHFECPSCRRRFVERSGEGLRETQVDLEAD